MSHGKKPRYFTLRGWAHLIAAVAVGSLVGSSVGIGVAQAATDPLARLVELNPGATEADVRESLEAASKELGQTYDQVLLQGLEEAEAAAVEGTSGCGGDECVNGGGGGKVPLQNEHAGAIFTSYATTALYPHGHTGIYSERSRIVHHPGAGDVSRFKWIHEEPTVTGPVSLYRVETTVAKREAAGEYALNSLRYKPYDYIFTFNRVNGASKLNCSELVWRAYMYVGINVDGNGGTAVFPSNIAADGSTTRYKTLN
ncbi:hypothetical protein [Stackebrandtia soli]|uniref:hypothetical protein n=1 Tax=Stackebrandtia soli TaxID=1892856 RepID=UPI0039EAA31D